LGACLHKIYPLGNNLYFHSLNQDPRLECRCRDDLETANIEWPNYHSGSNGDFQKIRLSEPKHEIFWNSAKGRWIEEFPAHPHEGAVGAPESVPEAQLLACGKSQITGREFGLVAALEATEQHGRGIAESSFHHFAAYNWNPDAGCPSFVIEPCGFEAKKNPDRLSDIKAFVANTATWLAHGAWPNQNSPTRSASL
jgi:hypothetical protein